MRFDFEATPSRDHDQALRDCQKFCGPAMPKRARVCGPALLRLPTPPGRAGHSTWRACLSSCATNSICATIPIFGTIGNSLNRSSRELMADIRGQISDLAPLPRDKACAKVLDCLNRDRACFLVGESGSGKSALAKQIGGADYDRCVWFTETAVDCDTEVAFEREIGLTHPLCEILAASPPAVPNRFR